MKLQKQRSNFLEEKQDVLHAPRHSAFFGCRGRVAKASRFPLPQLAFRHVNLVTEMDSPVWAWGHMKKREDTTELGRVILFENDIQFCIPIEEAFIED